MRSGLFISPMIDLHIHLLPAVDDGAASLEVSLAMLELARSHGFARLVATPHLDGPLSRSYAERVGAALSAVRSLAALHNVPISIDLGYEIQLSPDLPARLSAGETSTLAGSRTVLVELPFAGWPNFTEQTLFSIQTLGFRPLLAHPERYAAVQSDVARAIDLAERGIGLQVTLGSLVGLFGKPAQRIAEQLLKQDVVTVLATDAHSAGQRFVSAGDGLERAERLIGAARTRQLVVENPAALLENRQLPTPAAIPPSADGERHWQKVLARFRG